MKIKNPDIIQKITDPRKSVVKGTKTGNDFNRIFENSLNKTSSTDKLKAHGLGEPTALNFIKFQNSTPSLKMEVDTNIDLMDKYSKLIGDPKRSLKEIEPFLMKLISSVKDTQSTFKDESKNAPELFNILENILMTARKEQIKMANGDYN